MIFVSYVRIVMNDHMKCMCVLVFLKGDLKHLMFKYQCKSIQCGLWLSDGVTNKEIRNICPEAL